MRPAPSCRVQKLALPMTRLSTMRPATVAGAFSGSSSSLVLPPNFPCSSCERCSRRKSFGNATPFALRAFSFSRRSSMSLFSSSMRGFCLYTLFEAGGDEVVELAVEHGLRGAFLDAGAQVLDPRLVEH